MAAPTRRRNASDSGSFQSGAHQARRKPSGGGSRRRLSSGGSHHSFVMSPPSRPTSPDDVMSAPAVNKDLTTVYLWRITNQLENIAGSVGDEVEKFAERVDAWKTHHTGHKRKSASDLVEAFQGITKSSMQRLEYYASESRSQQRISQLKRAIDPSSVAPAQPAAPMFGGHNDDESKSRYRILKEEYKSWKLLQQIVSHRHQKRNGTTAAGRQPRDDRFAADGPAWSEFLESDHIARDRRMVLSWLEECAEDDGPDLEKIEGQLDSTSDGSGYFLSHGSVDTRESLKAQKRLRTWDADQGTPHILSKDGSDLVYHLDPDSISRLRKKLDVSDEHFETSFWLLCWEIFRRGKSLAEIRNLCEARQQLAKAAMLGACSEGYEQGSIASRSRWRAACRSATQKKCHNEYERAVFGLLGGDYKSMEQISDTWEDLCMALYNALLLARYKIFVGAKYAADLPPEVLYKLREQDSLDINTTPAQVMESINLHPIMQGTLRSEQTIIQQSMIKGDLLDLIVDCGIVLSRSTSLMPMIRSSQLQLSRPEQEASMKSFSSLRVLAHAYIILSELGVEIRDEASRDAAENVVVGYMDAILLAEKQIILPTYVGKLSKARADTTMASLLSFTDSAMMRNAFMNLMVKGPFDIPRLLTMQFELASNAFTASVQNASQTVESFSLLEPSNDDTWGGHGPRVIEIERPSQKDFEESTLVNSATWFSHLEGHWFQAFGAWTETALNLMVHRRVQSARELFDRVNPVKASRIKSYQVLGISLDVFTQDDQGDVSSPEELVDWPPQTRIRHNDSRINGDVEVDDNFKLQAMRMHAHIYGELVTLCNAIYSLHDFAYAADRAESGGALRDHRTGEERRARLVDVYTEVEAYADAVLAPGFLTKPVPTITLSATAVAAKLKLVREMYLPEVLLAFNAAAVCVAKLAKYDSLVESKQLGELIAGDDELTRCFVATGRMRELMASLANSAKALLVYNEEVRDNGKKKSGKGAASEHVWEVDMGQA